VPPPDSSFPPTQTEEASGGRDRIVFGVELLCPAHARAKGDRFFRPGGTLRQELWTLVFDYDLRNLPPGLAQGNESTDDLSFYDICVRYIASLHDFHDEFILPSDYVILGSAQSAAETSVGP
jgi:hypothetical protein